MQDEDKAKEQLIIEVHELRERVAETKKDKEKHKRAEVRHATTVVITISRQLGSGGSFVAQQVAKRLGYAYIDRQILEQASKELGVEEAEIEGRRERLQSFWEKLLSGFTLATPTPFTCRLRSGSPTKNWRRSSAVSLPI